LEGKTLYHQKRGGARPGWNGGENAKKEERIRSLGFVKGKSGEQKKTVERRGEKQTGFGVGVGAKKKREMGVVHSSRKPPCEGGGGFPIRKKSPLKINVIL